MPLFIIAVMFLRSVFKSRRQLLLANLALRQQVTMLRQSVKRPRATMADKLFWILFSRYVDGWCKVLGPWQYNGASSKDDIVPVCFY